MWILRKMRPLKMWILWKIGLWNCEFYEKLGFENVNFVNNEILKLRFLWKVRFSNCDFWINYAFFAPVWSWVYLNLPGLCRISASIKFQLTRNVLMKNDRRMMALSWSGRWLRSFSSNSCKSSQICWALAFPFSASLPPPPLPKPFLELKL